MRLKSRLRRVIQVFLESRLTFQVKKSVIMLAAVRRRLKETEMHSLNNNHHISQQKQHPLLTVGVMLSPLFYRNDHNIATYSEYKRKSFPSLNVKGRKKYKVTKCTLFPFFHISWLSNSEEDWRTYFSKQVGTISCESHIIKI